MTVNGVCPPLSDTTWKDLAKSIEALLNLIGDTRMCHVLPADTVARIAEAIR